MKYNISFSKGMFSYKASEAENWGLLEKLYVENYLNAQPSNQIRIPKIIHQIWLGGAIPQEYADLQATWKKKNPGWEYQLWTDKSVKDLKLINHEIYHKTKSIGAKSDILRYEILFRYGGLYVDTDFECLKPFDEIHHICDFYAGLLASPNPSILIGLIGSTPNNDIIKKNIEEISSVSKKSTPEQIFYSTGPMHFTKCFFNIIRTSNQKCIIFPSTFFYPSPNTNSGLAHDVQKEFIKPESYAIHYWHISWTKKKRTIIYVIKQILKYLMPYGLVKLVKIQYDK